MAATFDDKSASAKECNPDEINILEEADVEQYIHIDISVLAAANNANSSEG